MSKAAERARNIRIEKKLGKGPSASQNANKPDSLFSATTLEITILYVKQHDTVDGKGG